MRNFLVLFVFALLTATGCNESKLPAESEDSAVVESANDTGIVDEVSEEMDEAYDSLFVVVADTGYDYFALRNSMLRLHQSLGLTIDTMGRYWNSSQKKIALPDNDEDEMYAGEYYPRRFPSENLSLEYLSSYNENSNENTIAVVIGIFETEQEADSALTLLKPNFNAAFKIKSNIYLGCMH